MIPVGTVVKKHVLVTIYDPIEQNKMSVVTATLSYNKKQITNYYIRIAINLMCQYKKSRPRPTQSSERQS